jgi:hypothetical protein
MVSFSVYTGDSVVVGFWFRFFEFGFRTPTPPEIQILEGTEPQGEGQGYETKMKATGEGGYHYDHPHWTQDWHDGTGV